MGLAADGAGVSQRVEQFDVDHATKRGRRKTSGGSKMRRPGGRQRELGLAGRQKCTEIGWTIASGRSTQKGGNDTELYVSPKTDTRADVSS